MDLSAAPKILPISRIQPVNLFQVVLTIYSSQPDRTKHHRGLYSGILVETGLTSGNSSLRQADIAKRMMVEKLRRIDSEVKAHEQAHIARLGSYAND
ncbi:MAG: hypothetical protein AB1798_16145 [Spirochaetota bacterium]